MGGQSDGEAGNASLSVSTVIATVTALAAMGLGGLSAHNAEIAGNWRSEAEALEADLAEVEAELDEVEEELASTEDELDEVRAERDQAEEDLAFVEDQFAQTEDVAQELHLWTEDFILLGSNLDHCIDDLSGWFARQPPLYSSEAVWQPWIDEGYGIAGYCEDVRTDYAVWVDEFDRWMTGG